MFVLAGLSRAASYIDKIDNAFVNIDSGDVGSPWISDVGSQWISDDSEPMDVNPECARDYKKMLGKDQDS